MPEGNKVYVAGKVGKSEGDIKHLIRRLQGIGYEVTYDWTLNLVQKPFAEHLEQSAAASQMMLKGVMHADIVVILVPAEGGVGLFFEAGGAMISSMMLSFIQGQQRKRIYAVGGGNDRSIFFFDPSVTRIETLEDLFTQGHLPRLLVSQAVE